MQTSETINEIAAALAKAQGEMAGASKDSANPFFKSKYADLASVREAVKGPFSKQGIAYVQSPSTNGAVVSVETMLLHTSGQWIRGEVSCTAKDDSPQAVGSAITYLRRYALQSFAGVAPEDDDAEAAQGRGNGATHKQQQAPPAAAPKGYDEWLIDIGATVEEGTGRLRAAWKSAKQEYRDHLTRTDPKRIDAMRAAAAKVDASAVPA